MAITLFFPDPLDKEGEIKVVPLYIDIYKLRWKQAF